MPDRRVFQGRALRLIEFGISPVRGMRQLTAQEPDWVLAISPTLICAALQLLSAGVVAWKIAPRLERLAAELQLAGHGLSMILGISAINAAASYPIMLVISAVCLVAMDIAFNDGKEAKRLVEAAGLSMLTQIPQCLMLVILALKWVPVDSGLIGGAYYTQPARIDPASSAMVVIAARLSSLWLIAMLGIALREVAGMRLRSIAVGAGFVIAAAVAAHLLVSRL